MRTISCRILVCLFSILILSNVAFPPGKAFAEDEPGTVQGTVVDSKGKPVAGAAVALVERRLRVTTGEVGGFRFERVPAGRYLLEASSPRQGRALVTVEVEPGRAAEVRVELDLSVHVETIVVTAGPDVRGVSQITRPVGVLEGAELQEKSQPTLGETLAREPGIGSTYYSPGASRPIIRGLGGDRIRILEDGLGTGDASNVSEDHAVSADPLGADRIEILRGPATLLFGSQAVGGVINLLDGRIPEQPRDRPVSGALELRGGSNAREKTAGLTLNGGVRRFGWHLDGLRRETDDTEAPGEGELSNSDLESRGAAAGASWMGAHGFAGVSYAGFDTEYGIPNPSEPIRIDLQQRRVDLKGGYNLETGFLRGAKLRFGRTDYEHAEIEDTGDVGTMFDVVTWEGRAELLHRKAGPFLGAFGFQAQRRESEAVGDEAFLPPTATRNRALFVFEEIGQSPFTWQVGARFEEQDAEASEPSLPRRSFDAVSGSGGFVWEAPVGYAVAVSLSRSIRFPTAEELFANGPHLATFQFELGDPGLAEETTLGADVSLRRRTGIVHGELNLFTNRVDEYTFLQPTGNLVDVDGELIPEFLYVQQDADFRGAELHLDVEALHKEPHHLQVEFRADAVRAETRRDGDPLPRIPPYRTGVGVRYRGDRFWGHVEGLRTNRQDRVAAFETTTGGYTWLNAAVGYRFFAGRTVQDVILRGTNLGDREARNHVSPLKDLVPLPGRDLTLSYRVAF